MKKNLCLITLVLLMASALSATETEAVVPSYSGGLANAKAATQVSLNIGGGTGSAAKIELYFIDGKDLNQTAVSKAPANLKNSVELAFNDKANVADNAKSVVYAWWRVLYGGNLDIQLEIDKALSIAGSGLEAETIEWEATATVDTGKENDDQNSTGTTVYSSGSEGKPKTATFENHYGSTGVQSFGQAKIDIQTDADEIYSNIPAGKYSATLTLKCTTGN